MMCHTRNILTVGMFGIVLCSPVYQNQRQDAKDENFNLKFSDINIFVVDPYRLFKLFVKTVTTNKHPQQPTLTDVDSTEDITPSWPLGNAEALENVHTKPVETTQTYPEDTDKIGAVNQEVTINKESTKKQDEVLTLIGGSPEECGPDGHRNSEGICIYTPGV